MYWHLASGRYDALKKLVWYIMIKTETTETSSWHATYPPRDASRMLRYCVWKKPARNKGCGPSWQLSRIIELGRHISDTATVQSTNPSVQKFLFIFSFVVDCFIFFRVFFVGRSLKERFLVAYQQGIIKSSFLTTNLRKVMSYFLLGHEPVKFFP